MAEKAQDQPKRRIKSPETFRERTIKATEASEKPGAKSKVSKALGKVFLPLFRPIGKFFKKLVKIQPFKAIYTGLRWIGLVILPPYVRKSWKELKLVTWPSRKQSRQLTFAVLVFAVVFGIAVAVVDYGLDKLFKQILLK